MNILEALIFLVQVASFEGLYLRANENDIEEKLVEYQHCVCVPYWQCKEDYSGLIEDVVDIVDIRVLRSANYNESSAPCAADFDVCCKVECGRRRTTIPDLDDRMYSQEDIFGLRILGDNNEAEFAEFPWMLGVLHDKTYKCGASLIHPSVALTTAHCVSSEEAYKIRAGEWNWELNTEPLPHQDRMTKKIIIHPLYHRGSLRNDIALLILDKPFKLSENVGLACLPPQGAIFDNKRCLATGWGKNSYRKGSYQSTLKKMELPVVPRDKCTVSLRNARLGPYFNLHKSFICAGGEANKDTCKGDGGSPLICPIVGQPDRYEQVGIVAWGLTCGLKDTPGVYVNVALFRNWIDRQMVLHSFDINVYKY